MAFLTAITPGGTWYLLIPFDPIVAPFLFSIASDLSWFLLFAILGTAQWFFVGYLIDFAGYLIDSAVRHFQRRS